MKTQKLMFPIDQEDIIPRIGNPEVDQKYRCKNEKKLSISQQQRATKSSEL